MPNNCCQQKSHYEILGVGRDATYDAIRRAYLRLTRQKHPDVNKAPDAEERFKQINEAYAVLSDKDKRLRYDQLLEKLETEETLRCQKEAEQRLKTIFKKIISPFIVDRLRELRGILKRRWRPTKTSITVAIGVVLVLLFGTLGVANIFQSTADDPEVAVQPTPDVGATITAAIAAALATAMPTPIRTTETPLDRAVSPTAVPIVTAPPALTASTHRVPASHDGSAPFTFELRFSEGFPISYKTLRDRAFTVTGGEVKRARRLEQSKNLRWEIQVQPDGDGAVTIVLPVTTDCAASHAICTEDGRPLSNRLEITLTRAEE